MSQRADPSSAAFFDDKYRADPDPWRFGTDPYELGRYEAIVGHIDPDRHHRVFEPGCAIGVLTGLLAESCPEVYATDISTTAVRRAERRVSHRPGVTITVGGIIPPTGSSFDVIVLSEVGYYLTLDELHAAAVALADHVEPGGRVIAAHWIGTSPDHRLHGDEVHAVLDRVLHSWDHRTSQIHRDDVRDGYRLDVWDRP